MKLQVPKAPDKPANMIIIHDSGPCTQELREWIKALILENNCIILKMEWRSKYNSYVIYDYEPFCSDGYQIEITIDSINPVYMEYVQYEIAKRIAQINFLEEIFESPAFVK